MLRVNASVEAEEDIDLIASYTTRTWGWRQTNRYLAKLEDGFELLAQNPLIGRSCDSIRSGLRRFEIGKHVVFYIPDPREVLIVRVLHQQMIPSKSQFEQ
jgi:toxin ParE1/3/4